jgi:hypothetical protein
MSLVFNRFKKEILDGTIDLAGGTIKVMLVTSSYVANENDDFLEERVDDANEHELTGTGYTPGFASADRKTLSGKGFAEDDPNNRGEFDDSGDITWTGIDAGTVAGIVVYNHLTNDAASVMICYIDSGGLPIVTNGGDLTIQWNAEGILQLT